eukprot:364642-Chlamydomonas_euryale.AAC.1
MDGSVGGAFDSGADVSLPLRRGERWLWWVYHRCAPVASRDVPRYTYANRAGLECFDANWDELIGLDSTQSTPQDDAEELKVWAYTSVQAAVPPFRLTAWDNPLKCARSLVTVRPAAILQAMTKHDRPAVVQPSVVRPALPPALLSVQLSVQLSVHLFVVSVNPVADACQAAATSPLLIRLGKHQLSASDLKQSAPPLRCFPCTLMLPGPFQPSGRGGAERLGHCDAGGGEARDAQGAAGDAQKRAAVQRLRLLGGPGAWHACTMHARVANA